MRFHYHSKSTPIIACIALIGLQEYKQVISIILVRFKSSIDFT